MGHQKFNTKGISQVQNSDSSSSVADSNDLEEVSEEQKRVYTCRFSNWLAIPRLFQHGLSEDKVLLCFEFDGDISDPLVKRRLFDMFLVLKSDHALPKDIRFMCGKRFGNPPKPGHDLDAKIFLELYHSYIQPNQEKLKLFQVTQRITPTRINAAVKKVLGSQPAEVLAQFGVTADFKYSQRSCTRFKERWHICTERGILLNPPMSPAKELQYTQYAKENHYDKVGNSDTASESESVASVEVIVTQGTTSAKRMRTMPQKAALPALLGNQNIMFETNPYMGFKEKFRKLVGVESEFISRTHQKPIMENVYSIKAMLAEAVDASQAQIMNDAFCDKMMNLFVSGPQRKDILQKMAAVGSSSKVDQSSEHSNTLGEHTSSDGAQSAESDEEAAVLDSMLSDEERDNFKINDRELYHLNEFIRALVHRGVSASTIQYTLATTRFLSRAAVRGTFECLGREEVDVLLLEATRGTLLPEEDSAGKLERDMAGIFGQDTVSSSRQSGCSYMSTSKCAAEAMASEVEMSPPPLASEAELLEAIHRFADEVPLSDYDNCKMVGLDLFNNVVSPLLPVSMPLDLFSVPFRLLSGEVHTITVQEAAKTFHSKYEDLGEQEAAYKETLSETYWREDDEQLDTVRDRLQWRKATTSFATSQEDNITPLIASDLVTVSQGKLHESTPGTSSNLPITPPAAYQKTPVAAGDDGDLLVPLPSVSLQEEQSKGTKKRKQAPRSAKGEGASQNTSSQQSTSLTALRCGGVPVSKTDLNNFKINILPSLQRIYGEDILNLNKRAMSYSRDHHFKLTYFKPKSTLSPTGMWFHILNEESSQSAQFNKPRLWKQDVALNCKLNERLEKTGRGDRPRAVVENRADGTCLCNAVLTTLYLTKRFKHSVAKRIEAGDVVPPISPLHLKQMLMCHVAVHSHKELPNYEGQSYLSTYWHHHPDESYRTIHPHSVFSLQQELDNVLLQAKDAACSDHIKEVAQAVLTLSNQSKDDKTEADLIAACEIVDLYVQSFKTHRREVYADLLNECRDSMALSHNAEEMQLIAVSDVLGIQVEVYDSQQNVWLEFEPNDPPHGGRFSKKPPQKIILMKTADHYFATVDLSDVLRNKRSMPSEEELNAFREVETIWEYPAVERMSLFNPQVADRAIAFAVRDWAMQDRQAKIYNHHRDVLPSYYDRTKEKEDGISEIDLLREDQRYFGQRDDDQRDDDQSFHSEDEQMETSSDQGSAKKPKLERQEEFVFVEDMDDLKRRKKDQDKYARRGR